MKRLFQRKLLQTLGVCLLVFLAGKTGAVQLSGTYTINASLPASTTNFQNFASAITYMTSTGSRSDLGPANTGTVGVNGPVVFEVAAGTYTVTAAIVVPAINGSSAANTVTFDGGAGNAATRIITGSISGAAIVRMNLCSYVSFRNLTITNTNNGTRSGIAIIGNTSSTTAGTGCSVKYCIINLPNSPASAGVGINITANANGHTTTANWAQNVEIDSNTVNGGVTGIAMYGGTSTSYNAGIKIRGNKINNAYTNGISVQYVYRGVEISGNNITMSTVNTSTQYGVHFNYCRNTLTSSNVSHTIAGNSVKNSNTYGFYYYYSSSTSSYPSRIHNNMVNGGFRSASTNYGFYLYSATADVMHIQFFHNSVLMDFAGTTCNGMRYYNPGTGGTGIFKNNVFCNIGTSGTSVPAYFQTNNAGLTVNNNNYYNADGVTLLYRGSNQTAVNFRSNSSGGDSSINERPRFKGDLHLASGCLFKGTNLQTVVPVDIDGDVRGPRPDMGCDEFVGANDDLMAEEIISPVAPITLGMSQVSVLVRNVGNNVVNNYNVNYIHNGNFPVTQMVTTALNTCDTATITMTTSVILGASNDLVVYTSDPNYNIDADMTNDTLKGSYTQPLSGTYTIGGVAPDFASFTDALNALKGGVTGPVEFNVAAGTYTGPVIVDGPVPGTSFANQVVFNGASNNTSIITANTTTGATVIVRNASYVSFNNFSINNTSSGGTGFSLAGTTRGCSLKNSIINMTATTSNSYGVLVTGSSNGFTVTNSFSDSVVIDSNMVRNGRYGIYINGNSSSPSSMYNSGLKVRNNFVSNAAYMGIYTTNIYNAIDMLYNRVVLDSVSTYSDSYGIYIYNCPNTGGMASHQVIGNYVKYARFSAYYMYYLNGTLSYPDKIYNNVAAGGFGTEYEVYAFYLYNSGSGVSEVYHNTINVDSASGPSAGYEQGCMLWNGSPNTKIKNNIFALTSVSLTGMPACFHTYSSINQGNLNFNLYYNRASQDLLNINSTIYTPANYQTNGAGGDSSMNFLPPFVDLPGKDVKITSACLTGTDLLADVPLDIEGNTRVLPVLGAYSPAVLQDNLLIQELIQPVPPISLGAQDLIIRVQNAGSNIINTFTASYEHNNAAPVTQFYTGMLETCDTVSIVFSGASQITLVASNDIKVYTSSPNYMPDSDPTNDTVKVYYGQPMSGNYTIGGSSADFSSFTAAVNSLYTAGVGGPVTFVVNAGTYNEQVAITQPIVGLSAANTITFDGVDPTTRILTFSNTTYSQRHTLKINQSHIRIRNLGLHNDNSDYGWIVHIGASGVSNVHIKNCRFDFTNPNMYIGSYEHLAIIASTNSQYFQAWVPISVDSIEIDSNIMNANGAIVALAIDNNNYLNPPCNAISFRNNRVEGFYTFGVYMTHVKNYNISHNVFNMDKSGSGNAINIYGDWGSVGSIDGGEINGNVINNTYMGIYMEGGYYNSSTPVRITNNILSRFASGAYSGFYLYDCHYVKMYHNSVNYDVAASGNYSGAVNMDYCDNADIRNNHFIVNNPSMATAFYASSGLPSSVFNYNNLYKAGGFGLMVLGTTYNSNNFIGAGGYNVNSISVDPKFTNDSSLILHNGCLNGDSVIATDISGIQRASRPDLGAHEIVSPLNDAGVLALLEPVHPVVSGLQDVRVRITNYGTAPLTSADVAYKYNNNFPVSKLWTGNLATCDTVSVLFTSFEQVDIVAGTTGLIKAYTSNPNNAADTVNANDTLDTYLGTPLNGAYTIGGASPDFVSFIQAADALKYRGVSGPVVFNVRNGTYSGRVLIGEIPGASAVNTVTFQSQTGVASNVTLSATGNISSMATVELQGASYVNFKRLTISALSTAYGQCITFSGPCSYDTIQNCVLTTAAANSTSTNKAIIYANSFVGGNIVIRGNTFTNGAYSIYLYGINSLNLTANNVIDSNICNNAYYRSIWTYYTSNLKVRFNTIAPNTAYTTHYGISAGYGDNALEIVGNKITQTTGGYGIYHYYADGTISNRGLIANNVILVGGTGTARGIHSQYCSNSDIYNNTVNCTSTSTSAGYGAYLYYSSVTYSGNRVVNNIFSNTGSWAACYNYNPTVLGNTFDSNLIYSTSATLIQVGTPAGNFASLTTFRNTYPTQEARSITYRPPFTTNTNLVPNINDTVAWVINGRGLQNPLVKTDVNGVARPLTLEEGAPDWGAFEFTPVSVPPMAIATPVAPAAGTTQTFILLGDTIAQIEWDPFAGVPSNVTVRQYSGARPQNISLNEGHNFFYTDINASAGSYNYNIHLYYKDQWLGNVGSEADLRLAKQSGTNPWSPFVGMMSSVDPDRNILSAFSQASFSLFSGTDNTNPLPVKLSRFGAVITGKHVDVAWTTAEERNVQRYEIEVSADGRSFRVAGKVNALNKASGASYAFTHLNAQADMAGANVIYYRLVSVDRDGSSSVSAPVAVVFDQNRTLDNTVVYPNPFNHDVTLLIPSSTDGKAHVTMYDLQGRIIAESSYEVVSGANTFRLVQLENEQAGIYFIRVSMEGDVKVLKVVKQ